MGFAEHILSLWYLLVVLGLECLYAADVERDNARMSRVTNVVFSNLSRDNIRLIYDIDVVEIDWARSMRLL